MMTFSKIFGQERIKDSLRASVLNNRVPHTQLFSTIDGGSGLALALAQAKMLACDEPNTKDSCGECLSCKQFESFNYAGLNLSFPVEKKSVDITCASFHKQFIDALSETIFLTENIWKNSINIENKQLLIPVKEASDIIHKLSLKGYGNKPRVFIIWQPEAMNTQTANKLLKSLEEPGTNTYFMLVSHNPNRLLPTIKSRCIVVNVPSSNKEEFRAFFNSHNLNSEQISRVLLSSRGSIGKAIEELQQIEQNEKVADLFVAWARVLYAKNFAEILSWSENASALKREQLKHFLLFATNVFQQSFSLSIAKKDLLPFKHKDFDITRFLPFIKTHEMSSLLDTLEECRAHVERNGNSKIILLDTTLRLSKYIGKA